MSTKVTQTTATTTANRRLVLCFDGTGNQFRGDRSDTNVVKIYSMLARNSDNQYHYYQPGIGTYVLGAVSKTRDTISNGTEKLLDTMFGISFSDHVIAGYVFIMRYYTAEDDIYMFGFSRGAYTARFLAEMIDHIGLLSKGNEEMVGFAWRTYEQYMRAKPGSEDQRQKKKYMDRFRSTFCRAQCAVKFLGLFDCVNSTALFRDSFRPMIRPPARHVRHAVALDEKRVKFRASLFDVSPAITAEWKAENKAHSIDEQWFAGNHCNVGGGNEADLREKAEKDPILSDIALAWMMKEVLAIHERPMERREGCIPLYWDNESVVQLLNLGVDRDLVQVKDDAKWFVTGSKKDWDRPEAQEESGNIAKVVKDCILAREAKPYFYLDEEEVRFWRDSEVPEDEEHRKAIEKEKKSTFKRKKQQMMIDDMLSYSRNLFISEDWPWYKRFISTCQARQWALMWNFMEHLPLARVELNESLVTKEYELRRKLRRSSSYTDTKFLKAMKEEDPYAKWEVQYFPNRGGSRDLYEGANMHHSVLDRLLHFECWDYAPSNLHFDTAMQAQKYFQADWNPPVDGPQLGVYTQDQREALLSFDPETDGRAHQTRIGWAFSCFNPLNWRKKTPRARGYRLALSS